MGAQRDDGGPAFPRPYGGHPDPAAGDPEMQSQEGMSLRDHFAGLAMLAHLITDTVPGPACDALLDAAAEAGQEPLERIAFNAYECADAMLKERAK